MQRCIWRLCKELRLKFQETPDYVYNFIEEVLAKESFIMIFATIEGLTEVETRRLCQMTERSLR